jgi:pyruvate/2-oxoglutarate dehydrogenase complex dihydrolipoamide dehydrogenase (E3) component
MIPEGGNRGRYNLVVVGAGTAGLVTAAAAAGLGARVALVERRLMGGDCLNFGCVPSKALVRSARAAHDARTGGAFGVRGPEAAAFDFPAAMERMRRLRDELAVHDSVERFRDELGVDVFTGEGRFIGRDRVEVDGTRLDFHRAAICTGARPVVPAVPGLDGAGYLTNETVFSLARLPDRLAVIGAGPVGCELAQAFARFGSRVTLIGSRPQLLPREEPDAAAILAAAFARDGIDVRLDARLLSAARDGADRVLAIAQGGARTELRVDEILVAAGRDPVVDGLGLEAAGIRFDARRGVEVDDFLRTTNRAVFAAGDVCSSHRFTHVADAQARILVANALFPGRRRMSSSVVPWCTYTDPEVAHAGLSADEAGKRGIRTDALTMPMSAVDRAVLDGETDGFARVFLKKGTDTILGATIVARHAGEMIGELSLAISAGLPLSAVGNTIHPYPTQAEAIRKLADLRNRSRLTPRIAKLLALWMRWRRG